MKAGLHILLQMISILMGIDAWDYTAIMVKKKTNFSNTEKHMIGGGHFRELIQISDLWIDKSLLIKAIWEDSSTKVFMNACPQQWGKTITLGMLKFYHQIALNEDGSLAHREDAMNSLYFAQGKIWDGRTWEQTREPPLISKYPNHLRHLGKYPVIHLYGSGLTARADNGRTRFATMISIAYEEHKYLIQYLKMKSGNDPVALDNLKKFERFRDGSDSDTLSLDMYVDSISTLSRILNETYKEPVIILFDEYDGFIKDTYFQDSTLLDGDELADFINFFEKFMENTFKSNPFFEKGIITGILPILEAAGMSGFNNVELKRVFGLRDFYPFHGIFEYEFDTMADLRMIKKPNYSLAKQRYGGYRTLSHIDTPMFSTPSVFTFIGTLQLRDCFTSSFVAEILPRLFQCNDFAVDAGQLMNNWQSDKKSLITIPYRKILSLTREDFEIIFKLKNGIIKYNRNDHRTIVFPLLLSMGYVSVSPNQEYDIPTSDELDIGIKIPNWEIYAQFKPHFISSLGLASAGPLVTFTLHDFMRENEKNTLLALAIDMSNYLRQKMSDPDLRNVNDSIKVLSESFNRSFPIGNKALSEFFLLGFFFSKMSCYHVKSFGKLPNSPRSAMDQMNSTTKIDIFFSGRGKKALVVELKHNEANVFDARKTHLKKTFIRSLTYVQFFRNKTIDVQWVKLMAVVVHENDNMELMAISLTSFEVEEMIKDEDDYFSKNKSLSPEERREKWSNLMYVNLYETKRERIWVAQYDRTKKYHWVPYSVQTQVNKVPSPE